MKKVKIMLLSLLVVGAVGGALAFKAMKAIPKICWTTPRINAAGNPVCTDINGANLTCTLASLNQRSTQDDSHPLLCTTPVTAGANCNAPSVCPTSSFIRGE